MLQNKPVFTSTVLFVSTVITCARTPINWAESAGITRRLGGHAPFDRIADGHDQICEQILSFRLLVHFDLGTGTKLDFGNRGRHANLANCDEP